MPVPTNLSDLSPTAASNYPAATDTISTTDDYLRAHASILAKISDGTNALVSPTITTATITTANATTVDTTNLEVTNVKAKDGTAAVTIADSTGVVNFSAIPTITSNGSVVGTTATQTLTNKTLTAPAINGTVTTTGLTLPALTLSGNVTSTGNPSLNIGTGALTAGSGTFSGDSTFQTGTNTILTVKTSSASGVTGAAALYLGDATTAFASSLVYRSQSGNLEVGTGGNTRATFSSTGLSVNGETHTDTSATGTLTIRNSAGTSELAWTNNPGTIYTAAKYNATDHAWRIQGVDKMTLDASGNLLVGTTSGSWHNIRKNITVGNEVLYVGNNSEGSTFFGGDAAGYNSANTIQKIGRVTATGRSLNASGTINASGADYAEYENNNGLSIAKGAIVGFKSDGTLTLTFSEAVRFGIKSTNPSYVGGDTWGSEDVVGKRPEKAEDQTDEEFAPILAAWEAALEAERQKVDRVAYSGKVPVNVMGATAGGYIIAVDNAGQIDGEFVADPDFAQYKRAVGRVNRILEDGRAEVAVMVH